MPVGVDIYLLLAFKVVGLYQKAYKLIWFDLDSNYLFVMEFTTYYSKIIGIYSYKSSMRYNILRLVNKIFCDLNHNTGFHNYFVGNIYTVDLSYKMFEQREIDSQAKKINCASLWHKNCEV